MELLTWLEDSLFLNIYQIKTDYRMQIKQYIQDIKSLPEPRKTFIEIMKVHQSEVHMANLLAYFFKSEETHGLGKLFIEALFETKCFSLKNNKKNSIGSLISQNISIVDNQVKFLKSISKVNVKNEIETKKAQIDQNKRIDILLQSDEFVVCIEFKINHELTNPLQSYQEHIVQEEDDIQKINGKRRLLYFVVLTPYKKSPSKSVQEFVNNEKNKFSEMILSHFVKNVVNRIPPNYFIENSDNTNWHYLVDFIQTINNREIRYKRREILKDLQNHINSEINNEYHSKGLNGGFIQLNFNDSKYKIRIINNSQFQIEKWSKDNELKKKYPPLNISCSNKYNTILKELGSITKTALNKIQQ